MLRAIKPCTFLSGWTNIIRTSQKRVASTAFGVQRALNNNESTKSETNIAVDKIDDRVNYLKRRVMRNNYISEKHFQLFLNIVKACPPNQAIISFMQCFGLMATYNPPEQRINYVNEVWDRLKNSGINLDVSYYNILLSVYVENEHKFSPMEILNEMKINNIKPNRVTYRYLLSHFCREGDLSGASSILEMMKNESILYNEHIFHELILGYCIAKDINGAENIIEVMKEKKFDVGSSTYLAYLGGLAMSGDLEKFDSVFKKCEEDGIILKHEYLNVILYNLVICGQTSRACEIIQSYGHILQDSLHLLLLRILNKKKYNECLHILSILGEKDSQNTLENTIWNYLAENESFETFKNLADDLEKKGQGSDFLLKALFYTLREKKFNNSLNIIRHLNDNGHLPKEIYFWPIVAHAVQENNVDKVLKILNTMKHEFRVKLSNALLVRVIFYNISEPLAERRLKRGLSSLGLSDSYIQEMYALSCLYRNRLDKIYKLSNFTNPSKFIGLVVGALTKRPEAQSPAKVVGLIHNLALSAGRRPSAGEVSNESILDDNPENISGSPQDVVDTVMKGLVSELHKSKHHFLKGVLEEMVRCKIPVSEEVGELIKTEITEPNVRNIVDKLIKLPPLKVLDDLNNQNNKNSNSNLGITERFIRFCKENMIEEAEKILEEHPRLLDRCSYHFMKALRRTNNEEKFNDCVMKHVTKIRENGEGFQNNTILITELLKKGFIKEACMSLGNFGNKQSEKTALMEMLGSFLYNASTNDISSLLSTINENENIISLRDIIRYYRDKRNFVKIIEILEKCHTENVQKLRLRVNLIKPLIEEEETELVKKVVSTLEKNFPTSSVVNELIFSYTYIGDMEKARECLDKFAYRRNYFIVTALNIKNDIIRVKVLENMLSIMPQLQTNDSRQIYERLIEDYNAMKADPQKGLALLKQIQDTGLVVSPVFLVYLTRLLKENNMPVPFDKSNFEDQEWLLNCNIPRPVLNQLLVNHHCRNAKGVDEVIRQGIKNNLILSSTIKRMLACIEEKADEMQMKNTLEYFLPLAEYKEAFDQCRLLQHVMILTKSRDPQIILKSIPHAFLLDCLMTGTFDELPSEIAHIIMWAYCCEILEDVYLAQIYETEVQHFIKQRSVVEGLLKFAPYFKVKSRILKFLLSQGVFQPFGLEREAAFISRYRTDTTNDYEQRDREQSLKSGDDSEDTIGY